MKSLFLLIFLINSVFVELYAQELTHKIKPTKINPTTKLTRVAFGSCNDQDEDQPLWKKVMSAQPDLWVWLGDAVYADSHNRNELKAAYQQQIDRSEYQDFINKIPIIGTWDDHDFGENDGGKMYPLKSYSQDLFLDFLGVAQDSPRRKRSGIYSRHLVGPHGRQVEFILLDTRFHRDQPGSSGDILGVQQWDFLEKALQKSSAQVIVIASGIQVLAKDHKFEKWSNFPKSRHRLLHLVHSYQPNKVIFLSGDRHISEISRLDMNGSLIYDITSSGLTHYYRNFSSERNDLRVGEVYAGLSYGLLRFDWSTSGVAVNIELRDVSNGVQQQQTVHIDY